MWQAEECDRARKKTLPLYKNNSLNLMWDKSRQERDSAKQEAETFKRLAEAGKLATLPANNLDQLIQPGSCPKTQRKEGPSQLLSASRALVSARKSLVSSLDVIQSRLDGDIDELEKGIIAKTEAGRNVRVAFLLDVLRRNKWPTKKAEIELAILEN